MQPVSATDPQLCLSQPCYLELLYEPEAAARSTNPSKHWNMRAWDALE